MISCFFYYFILSSPPPKCFHSRDETAFHTCSSDASLLCFIASYPHVVTFKSSIGLADSSCWQEIMRGLNPRKAIILREMRDRERYNNRFQLAFVKGCRLEGAFHEQWKARRRMQACQASSSVHGFHRHPFQRHLIF